MVTPPYSAARLSRRDFLARASLGLAAAYALPRAFGAAADSNSSATASASNGAKRHFDIAGFEKHFFEKYSPAELAETFDEMNLDVELTVRPEGHVKPANAADELPVLMAALAARKRRIQTIATSFVRPDEPHIESTLRTAQKLGIRQYRHRGFSYVAGKPIKAQVADFRSQAREFAAINRQIGITALYQNHAGADAVGAAIWDIDSILDDIDPNLFGVALDCRHLMVEQGRAWPTAIRLISPRVRSLYVKSFRWDRDKTIETPLSEGIVQKELIDQVLADHPNVPVCLHVEHLKLQPVPFAERASTVEAFRKDAAVLRGWLGATS
ncbi:MAG: TIM barrel protein [Opitutus sp.]